MKRGRSQTEAKGTIELIEEGVHLLRRAPMATLAMYYIGSLPFVVGLLYFWAEMSTSPFADRHLAGESLGLAALFIWMKVWQARFSSSLWGRIGGDRLDNAGLGGWWHILVSQAALQVSGLLLLPAALVIVAPFGWVYAFYQNATVAPRIAGDSGPESEAATGMRQTFKRAWKHTLLWPWQNHVLLGILFAFGLFVFLNWMVVCLSLPALAKMFFGIETVFTRSMFAMLNSTFFAAMLGLTYLTMDPLIKAVYTLRCFYGEARQSGQDLRAELKELRAAAFVAIGMFLTVGTNVAQVSQPAVSPISNRQTVETEQGLETVYALQAGLGENAQTPVLAGVAENIQAPAAAQAPSKGASVESSSAQGRSVPPSELDQEIRRVMEQRKYTWRFPRETEKGSTEDAGPIARFTRRVGEMVRQWAISTRDWVKKILEKLQRRAANRPGTGVGWMFSPHLLLYVLMAIVLATIGILLYRLFGKAGAKRAPILTEAIQPGVNLLDENVGAEQLPEDSWTALGRELLQRGELRLALRAFYLASLAHLAGRNLIRLARFKSNRDYARELERRGHSLPQLPGTFSENVMVFDRVWYGTHEITPELVNQFVSRVERIKGAG